MKISNGIITAGDLRNLIKTLKDTDPILIMCEDFASGVGGNAFEIQYNPPLTGKEKAQAIEDEENWEATLWIIS